MARGALEKAILTSVYMFFALRLNVSWLASGFFGMIDDEHINRHLSHFRASPGRSVRVERRERLSFVAGFIEVHSREMS